MIIKKQITEDIDSSIFDTAISAETLLARKISLARVLEQVKKALSVAGSSGETALAGQLQAKADKLQELLDRADEASASLDSGGGDGRGSHTDAEDSSSGDSEEDRDSKDTEPKEPSDDLSGSENDVGDGIGNAKGDDTSDKTDHGDKKDKSGSGGTPGDPEDPVNPGDPGKTGDPDNPDLPGDPGEPTEPDAPPEPGGTEGDSVTTTKGDGDTEGGDGDTTGDDGDTSGDGDDGDGDGDDTDDDGSTSKPKIKDGKIFIDPFKKTSGGKLPKDLKDKLDKGELETESVFDAAKRILSGLSGEAKRGASDGLKSLLSDRGIVSEGFTHSLREALTKVLSQMSDDEFNDELASAMELVDRVLKIDYSDDLDARVAEIKRDAISSTSRMELEREDSEHVKDERKAIKAFERENDKYKKIKGLRGLDSFKATLYRAVKDQVDEADDEVDTWAALDRRHEDDPDIVKKGHILDDSDEDIPTVNVYFDQSGSWTNREIEIGKSAISVINEFHENGEIKLNILYMSAGGIFTTAAAARAHPAAEGWHAALKHIRESKAKNVVILSDNDLDEYEWNNRPTGDNGRTIVDGCVWWLWKNNWVSKKAPKELIGRRGNYHYQFTTSR